MENREDILDELTNFEKKRPREIPQILEDYLAQIAKTGDTIFPWSKLKPLFILKMATVIAEFNETCPTDDIIHCSNVERFRFEGMKEKLLEAVDNFNSAPFTIQRLCELVTSPKKHYKHTDKFMRGLEKNVLVVSTVEPGCSHIYACDCLRKKAEHQTALLNGVADGNLNGVESFDSYVENKPTTPLSPTSPNGSDVNGNADKAESCTTIDNNKDNNNTTECKKVNEEETEGLNEEISTNVMIDENSCENSKNENVVAQETESVNSDNIASSSSSDSLEEKNDILGSNSDESTFKTEEVTRSDRDEVDDNYREKSKHSDDEKNEAEEQIELTGNEIEPKDEPKPSKETDTRNSDDVNSDLGEDDQSSALNLYDSASPSLATAIEDDDDAEENLQSSDTDDMTLPVHSPDEAADIDDNTMDVPLSEDSDSSSLNMVTSVDPSSNEMQDNAEPMDED